MKQKTRRATNNNSSRIGFSFLFGEIFVFHFLFFSSCNYFYFPFRRTRIRDLCYNLELRSMNI